MEISATIEPLNGRGFRASITRPFAASVEALTRDEAVELLRREVDERMAAGVEFVTLEVGNGHRPSGTNNTATMEGSSRASRLEVLDRFAGDLRDDPDFEDWVEILRRNREAADSRPDPF